MSLRVVMFPAVGNRQENRYIDILVRALRRAGVVVSDWNKHLSIQSGDIFHVHWPEVISDIRARRFQRGRGDIIRRNFFATIRRIKRSGGKVAWTVHDLHPHDPGLAEMDFNTVLMADFVKSVDLIVSLTESGKAQILDMFPELSRVPVRLGRHPHYRDVLAPGRLSETVRSRLGVTPDQRVFCCLGSLRANKRPDLVSGLFAQLPPDRHFLLMAGSCPAETAARISADLAGLGNIYLSFAGVSAAEMAELYSAADMCVFAGQNYFNSGTIYTALSLNVPVIAARTPQTMELQDLVGREWLYLYDGDLSVDALMDGLASVADRSKAGMCDLSAFDPHLCALQHIAAYQDVLK